MRKPKVLKPHIVASAKVVQALAPPSGGGDVSKLDEVLDLWVIHFQTLKMGDVGRYWVT